MRTWRSIEMVYGRAYMTRLRRRILVSHVLVSVASFLLGWWLRG